MLTRIVAATVGTAAFWTAVAILWRSAPIVWFRRKLTEDARKQRHVEVQAALTAVLENGNPITNKLTVLGEDIAVVREDLNTYRVVVADNLEKYRAEVAAKTDETTRVITTRLDTLTAGQVAMRQDANVYAQTVAERTASAAAEVLAKVDANREALKALSDTVAVHAHADLAAFERIEVHLVSQDTEASGPHDVNVVNAADAPVPVLDTNGPQS